MWAIATETLAMPDDECCDCEDTRPRRTVVSLGMAIDEEAPVREAV
jgi:hypothetical protein